MNLPNKISLIRICLIPLVIFFYLADFIPYGKLISFLIYVIAGCTDFVDGMIARKRGLVTDLGKLLDPIADKCLVMSVLVLIISWPVSGPGVESAMPIMGSVPNYVGIIGIVGTILILSREFIISALRQIAASKNFVMMADKSGKLKAVIQDVAIGGYMLYAFVISEFAISKTLNAVFAFGLLILFCLAVLLTITSGINYMVKNKAVLRERKKTEMTAVEKPLNKPVAKINREEE